MRIVFIGLTLSSSWGNGHATTYRALLKGLSRRGHDVAFLERETPWYAANQDLTDPDYALLAFYADFDDLRRRFTVLVSEADAVIIGSYVQEGSAVIDWAANTAHGACAFYDIDTPVTLAQLRVGERRYISPEQIPELDLYLSFTGGPTLDRLERVYGARRARALYCAVDLDLYHPMQDAPKQWSLGYLGTYSEDRATGLDVRLLEPARHLPHKRFVVAGSGYPRTMEWPANVERIEHLPPSRHPVFYNQQRFTVNITRADMIERGWSPSVRIFEAAACAAPIISDRWEGLDALLGEGEGVLIADTCEDVLNFLQMSAAERQRIANCGRDKVAAAHSAVKRAEEFEIYFNETFTPAVRREEVAV